MTLTAGKSALAQQSVSVQERAQESYGRLPLAFEANDGQASAEVRYLARGANYMLLVGDADTILARRRVEPCAAPVRSAHAAKAHCGLENDLFNLQLLGTRVGGRANGTARGEEMLPGKVNTLLGNEPAKWHTGAATYRRVRVPEVYPSIDLVYYGDQQRLEYDFDVAPGADPKAIRFRFTGGRLRLNSEGDLVATVKGQDVIFRRPVIYQRIDGVERRVAGGFVLSEGSTLRFRVGRYDRSKPLIIDPVLSYSTYIPGSSTMGWGGAAVTAIAVDSSGSAYITGVGTAIPTTPGAFQLNNVAAHYGGNAYVMKLNPTGTAVVYATYLGGTGGYPIEPPPYDAGDGGNGIAVDGSGNAYVTGFTYSADFPVKNPIQGTNNGADNGNDNAFVTELNPDGSTLVYSTYLGGGGFGNGLGDSGTGIAVDSGGAAYVVGAAVSSDFPVTAGTVQQSGSIFVAKIATGGTSLAYSTYFGPAPVPGGGFDLAASGIAVDASGDAYITGYAFPINGSTIGVTSGAYQQTNHSGYATNAFVTKFNTTGTMLVYCTYLGGSSTTYTNSYGYASYIGDAGIAIAVDSAGNAYVTGSAGSEDFPVTSGALQTTNHAEAGFTDTFITKLNAAGSALVYSTYLGGTGSGGGIYPPAGTTPYSDVGNAIAVDSAGNAYVAGSTGSADFPVTAGAYQTVNHALANKNTNGFVAKLNAAGSGLLYSTYLGGSSGTNAFGGDYVTGIAVDTTDHIYVGGVASSSDFPTTTGAYQTTGSFSGFVSRFDLGAQSQYALSVTPATLSLFANQVGEASAATVITVANSGSVDVTINGISITGTNAGEFTQTNTCGATLAANGACTISVVFTPTVAGAQTAALSIADNATGSPQTVTLTGNETVYPPDPEWSPIQLTFGPQAIGSTSPAQMATFTNQGKGPLTITSISLDQQYYVQTNNCGTTLGAGASCLFHVSFTPPVAGQINSGIFVYDNATDSPQILEFSGTGVAVTVGVSPVSLSFANQAVGSSSAAQTVTLTNSTTAAATITSIGVTGDFAETNNCNGTVPANGSCSLQLTFTPTAAGSRSGVLTITDTATGSPQMVTLSGTSVAPAVTLSATTLSFAQQAVGSTSAAQTVMVTNSGQAALVIASIAASGDFAETNTCGTSLAAAASCSITVTFTPTATGVRSGTLKVTDNVAGSPQMVTLSGTGVAPAVTLSATTLNFAQQAVGSTSAAQTVMVTNSGQAALAITSIAASGDFAQTNTCGSSLAAGANCSIAVTFKPTATGSRTGTLTITDNATGSPQTVTLSGMGVAPVPMATLAPASLTFSGQAVGSTSEAQVVTLTNGGQAALAIASIAASGDFAETNTCGTSLAAAVSCSIAVTFTPTDSGIRSGAITVTDNAAGSLQTVALSGTGASVGATVSSTNLTISAAGGSATDTITISSLQGFSGTVMLSCTVQAVGSTTVHDPPTCSLNPTQAQVANGSSVSVTLTVSTTAAKSSAQPAAAFLGGGALLTLLLLRSPARWRRRFHGGAWLVLLLGLGVLGVATGCGGHSSTPGDMGTTAGSYQVVVTATGASDAKVTASSTISLTLQ